MNPFRGTAFDLSGRVAIVTGADGGLGRSISALLASAGAHVVLSSEDDRRCRQEAAALRLAGHAVSAIPADARRATDLEALVAGAVRTAGGLDVVVANAGIAGDARGTLAAGEGDYRNVMAINLDAAVTLCALAVPHLRRGGRGSLVLMSSLAGLRGNRQLGAYALSKAALSQLARNLAVEHGPDGIRANAVAPGLIRTPMADSLLQDDEFMERRLALTPLRRIGEPEEVAAVVLLLASSAGAFITGQTLVVDGGTLISDGN